jgi:crotonobetainyl-CoA:carnitine CoA-transferase CaiB-like acyl-CoA transferase
LDVGWPYCALQLAQLGAGVIRIESNQRPCMNRRVPPYAGDEPGLNRGGSFNQWNQAKKSVLLDMKQPQAVELTRDLAAISDVFIENYAAGVVDRLGLGYDELSRRNPRLVMCSLSGYGLTGPYRSRVAFGTPLTMISGLASLSGYIGHGRARWASYGDPNAGLHEPSPFSPRSGSARRPGAVHRPLAVGIAVAILPEGILPFTMRGEQVARMGNRDIQWAPHGIYPAKGEDRWISIAIRSDEDWGKLSRHIGGGLQDDPRFATARLRKEHEDELDAAVAAWTSARDEWELTEFLQADHLAVAPAMDMRDVAEDPHMNERGFFVRLSTRRRASSSTRASRGSSTARPWRSRARALHGRGQRIRGDGAAGAFARGVRAAAGERGA